ncbi:Replication protein A1 [Carabus blaptoides fortunei]
MAAPKLSEGALSVIMSGDVVEEPVLQVLGSKKIVGNAEKERYRLLVSDGKYQISFAMIATQINDKVSSGQLGINCVIKVKKYITSMISNVGKPDRRVLVILDLEILHTAEEVNSKIGNPTPLSDDGTKAPTGCASPPPAPRPVPKPAPRAMETSSAMDMNTSTSSGPLTVPIANLSPYANKWVIKARVTNKSPIRSWSNSKGEGRLFSMDLADESGEIRATVFRDLVDKYHDMIEVDKVYYIGKCQLKSANKQFNHLNNDYEMTFNTETTVAPCYEEVIVQAPVFDFEPLENILTQDTGSMMDVIGVCKHASDVQTITTRSTNKELKKRELILVDQSGTSVTLTLWGNEAEQFNGENEPIIAIRRAKVGEFGGGKNLSVMLNSVYKLNPDMPEAHKLRGWYDNGGKEGSFNDISSRTSFGGSMTYKWMSLAEAQERMSSADEQNVEYYQCKATVLLINTANALYRACPIADCNKKIIDLDNGMYRCEKCDTQYDKFKYRLVMSCNIGDWSDNQWVSMFASEAEKIINMTSQELGEATADKPEDLVKICNNANFSEFIFKCRGKMSSYNDETRLRCVVLKVEPVNYKEYHAQMYKDIMDCIQN